jgi:hypothetical protein
MNGPTCLFWANLTPFSLQSTSGAITGLETNVMSWGQFWNYDKVPLVSAYKSLEPRHLPHLTERWTTNRTDGFHTSFFNGMGFGSWENIWSVYNQITPFHGEMLRRMATILRNTNGITHASFGPHAPVTLQAGVYASNFTNATHTLWTVVGPGFGRVVALYSHPPTLHQINYENRCLCL